MNPSRQIMTRRLGRETLSLLPFVRFWSLYAAGIKQRREPIAVPAAEGEYFADAHASPASAP